MNSGIVVVCDHNGIVLHVYRDDFHIFGSPVSNRHLSQYVTATSREEASRFFQMLSNDGLSACGPIEFMVDKTPKPLFCTGIRFRECFILFGASSRSDLGPLVSGILYPDEVPVNFSLLCGPGLTTESRRSTDYKVYEDLTRLNNELVDLSRDLTDAQVEIEMESEELNKEIRVRKQAEEALELANKKLNLLTSITRHDIGNQLTMLRGFLSLLKKKQTDPSFNEYFQKIDNSAQRISAMIQFTKTYENIGVKSPVWQEVRTLVADAVNDIVLGDIRLVNEIPAGRDVFADPLIIKVFYNLVDNAVRYGGKITNIRFTIEKSGDGHMIVCEDDGYGVPVDEKEQIFERGFGKNTGLGLFLSREILDITGITIAETGEPGEGARFEMLVPKGMFR